MITRHGKRNITTYHVTNMKEENDGNKDRGNIIRLFNFPNESVQHSAIEMGSGSDKCNDLFFHCLGSVALLAKVAGCNSLAKSEVCSSSNSTGVNPPGVSGYPKIGSDWLQMGQIWDFLRSVSVHFGARAKMY